MKAMLGVLTGLTLALLAGCQGTEGPPSSPAPATTAPITAVPTSGNTSTPVPPPVLPPTMMPDKDMTHTLTADTPYFTSMPKKDTAPTGTFKAGTKVLVMIPGAPYSKVTAQDGTTAYTLTDNLQPMGK